MTEISINPVKLHQELLNASLPVVSVSSDGRVDYSRELTSTEKSTASQVIEAHDPAQTTEEVRIEAYFEAGITLQSMLFALWAKVMQDDPASADEIQTVLNQINVLIN